QDIWGHILRFLQILFLFCWRLIQKFDFFFRMKFMIQLRKEIEVDSNNKFFIFRINQSSFRVPQVPETNEFILAPRLGWNHVYYGLVFWKKNNRKGGSFIKYVTK